MLFLFISVLDEEEDLTSMLYDDNAPRKEVFIHRSNIRKEMIEIFSDKSNSGFLIDVIVIDAQGQQEEGRGRGGASWSYFAPFPPPPPEKSNVDCSISSTVQTSAPSQH